MKQIIFFVTFFYYDLSHNKSILFLFVLFSLLLVLEIIYIIVIIRKALNNSSADSASLNRRIDDELKNNHIFLKKLWFKLGQLYMPNLFSVVVLTIIGFLLFFLARIHLHLGEDLLFYSENHFQNLIAISAGIGTVIFALLIFVAECLRNDLEKSLALLKANLLYPLSFLGIIVLLIFLWAKVSSGVIIVVLIIAFIALYSVYQTIKFFLNPASATKQEHTLFKDRIHNMIEEAVRQRVGNNIYLKTLEGDKYNVNYTFLDVTNDQYTTINVNKVGIITDINFDALKKLFFKLEKLANEHDSSFELTTTGRSIDSSSLESSEEYQPTRLKNKEPQKAFLLKKYMDRLDGGSPEALKVPSFIISKDDDERDLTRLLEKVFQISINEIDQPKSNVRIELNKTKDIAIDAIRTGRTGKIEEVSDLYIYAVESFLEVMKTLGGGYSRESARQERSSLLGGWDEIRWISDDLRNLLDEAVKTENINVISILTYIPIAISFKSIEFSDHFVFQEFVGFQTDLYRFSLKANDDKIKKFLLDRSWRYLKEIAEYNVAAKMDKQGKKKDDIISLKDFGIDILQVLQSLIKLSYDNCDIGSFESYCQTTDLLFHRFKPSQEYPRAKDYELQLQADIDSKTKKSLEEQKLKQETLEELEKEIYSRKKQLFFGASSWILNDAVRNEFDKTKIVFWDRIKQYLPKTISDIFDIYQDTKSFKAEHFWGWSWWETENLPEGVVGSINFGDKLDLLFCVKLLESIENLPGQQIEETKIESTRDMVYLIEKEDSPLRNLLNKINTDKDKWTAIIPVKSLDKIKSLFNLFDKIVDIEKAKEEELLVSSAVNQVEINTFYNDFIKSFNTENNLRKLFQKNNKYIVMKRRLKSTTYQWGFNQIDDKAAFIHDWPVGYPQWGENYGQELAMAEDKRIYNEIIKNIPNKKVNDQDLGKVIAREIDSFCKKGFMPSVILTSITLSGYYHIKTGDYEFIPQHRLEDKLINTPALIGAFKYKNYIVPVVEIRVDQNMDANDFCILDLKKYAKLIQHLPYTSAAEKLFLKDIFMFKIADLNKEDELRQKILDQKPTWLKTQSDPDKHLKQKVLINILENFELRIINKRAGIRVQITNLDTNL